MLTYVLIFQNPMFPIAPIVMGLYVSLKEAKSFAPSTLNWKPSIEIPKTWVAKADTLYYIQEIENGLTETRRPY